MNNTETYNCYYELSWLSPKRHPPAYTRALRRVYTTPQEAHYITNYDPFKTRPLLPCFASCALGSGSQLAPTSAAMR